MDGSNLDLNPLSFCWFPPTQQDPASRQASLQLKQDSLPGVGLLRLQINALQQGPNFAPFLGESSKGGR